MRGFLAITGFVLALGFASWSGSGTIRTAHAQQRGGLQTAALQQNLTTVIIRAESDASHRHLSESDTRSLVHDSAQAAIIQSGGEPQAVLAALSGLPSDIFTSTAAKAAIAALKAEIETLAAQSKDTGSPSATGGPNQAPAIISAPPPSAGGGGGGGSDYRPG